MISRVSFMRSVVWFTTATRSQVAVDLEAYRELPGEDLVEARRGGRVAGSG